MHGLCRWLFFDTNRLGIDGIVMLGRICQGGQRYELYRDRIFSLIIVLFLFIGIGSTTHTNMITPCDMCPDIANTVYIVIAFESYEMYRLLQRNQKIKQHNPTKTWGQRHCSARVSSCCTTCDTRHVTFFTRV